MLEVFCLMPFLSLSRNAHWLLGSAIFRLCCLPSFSVAVCHPLVPLLAVLYFFSSGSDPVFLQLQVDFFDMTCLTIMVKEFQNTFIVYIIIKHLYERCFPFHKMNKFSALGGIYTWWMLLFYVYLFTSKLHT